MADADQVLQGFFIGSLTLGTLSILVYCLRKKYNTYNMKKSASMEDLNSVATTDPDTV